MLKSNTNEISHLAHNPIDPCDPYLDELFNSYKEHIWQSLNYYRFLYWLVHNYKPAVSIEIGVEYGVASAHMCSAAKEYGGQVIGVDIHTHQVPHGLNDHYGNYTFLITGSIIGETLNVVKTIVEKYGKVGVVYQDSSHHYAESVLEWELYHPFLDENAIWVCDDILPAFFERGVDAKSMVAYFDERPGTHMLFPQILHKGNTIGVICDIH